MQKIVLLILASLLFSCAEPRAIADFAALAQQSATLFPAMSAIGYNSCVASERYIQMRTDKFDQDFRFDQKAIDEHCAFAKQTETRLDKEYEVLNAYFTALGKLAGYDLSKVDKSLVNVAEEIAPLAGATSSQVTAVGGLVSVIAGIVTKGWRVKELQSHIAAAQPHVHTLCTSFMSDIHRFEAEHIHNRKEQLGSLYREAGIRAPATSPILLTFSYQGEMEAIDRQLDALHSFDVIFAKIDEGHTKLNAAGHQVLTRTTAGTLSETASNLAHALNSAKKALSAN
jgi:hypothetical protein